MVDRFLFGLLRIGHVPLDFRRLCFLIRRVTDEENQEKKERNLIFRNRAVTLCGTFLMMMIFAKSDVPLHILLYYSYKLIELNHKVSRT